MNRIEYDVKFDYLPLIVVLAVHGGIAVATFFKKAKGKAFWDAEVCEVHSRCTSRQINQK